MTRARRRLVIDGVTWRYNDAFSLWSVASSGITLVRADNAVRVTAISPYRDGRTVLAVRVEATRGTPVTVTPTGRLWRGPDELLPTWTPGVLTRIVRWALDPAAPKDLLGPSSAPAPMTPVETFTAALLRPPGPSAARARAVCEDILGRPMADVNLAAPARDLARSRRLVARVWEALALRDVIPAAWLDDGARRFVASAECALPDEDALPLDGWDAPCVGLSVPAGLATALALARDPGGALRAESLALEALARMAPLCAHPVPTAPLLWRIDNDPAARATVSTRAADDRTGGRAIATVASLVDRHLGPAPEREASDRVDANLVPWSDAPGRTLAHLAHLDRAYALRWRALCDADARITAGAHPGLDGVRFVDLADPWAPLVELWQSGWGVDLWRVSGVALVAPDAG